MPRLILSTSNVMGGGPPIIRRATSEKSNDELTTALQANIQAAQEESRVYREHVTNGTGQGSPNGTKMKRLPLSTWTEREDETDLYIPAVDWSSSGLVEERSAYDITVKLFFLPNVPASRRGTLADEAVRLVLKELKVPSVNLLIVSFPGIAFDADADSGERGDWEEPPSSGESPTQARPEGMGSIVKTWVALERLHISGTVARLGVSEFGSERLRRLLESTNVKPSVDQINLRDCCVVPPALIKYARQEGIQLLTHNECVDILPRGTLRELLGPSGAGVLASRDQKESCEGLRGEVQPQFVVKYTAVVKDRGVVENKGYFAVAELQH